MILKIAILIIIMMVYICYKLYFKDYIYVKKAFKTLRDFLDTRDTLVLKMIPEVEDKKIASIIVAMITERRDNFKTSYNNAILSDIKLNSDLKLLYENLSKMQMNKIVIGLFKQTVNIEKSLKELRNEYNSKVEKYNNNLVNHKFICLKLIRMKPLDTYKVKTIKNGKE